MRLLTLLLLFGTGLAGNDTLLLKSVDAGKTWTDIDPGPSERFLRWLHIDSHSSTLYVLTQRALGDAWRLAVSKDGGQAWQTRQSFAPAIWNILAAKSSVPDTLTLAYEVPGGTQKSVMIARVTNGGESIEEYQAEGLTIDPPQAGLGSSYASLIDLAGAPAVPSHLYALVTNEYADDIYAIFQALWASVDSGRSWRRLEPPVTRGCGYPEVQIDPLDSSVYLACGNELFRSADGGASWTPKPFPEGKRLWSLQFGAGEPAVLFGDRQGVIWKSTDGAETWQHLGTLPLASQARYLTPHPVDPSLLFAATPNGVVKSEDGGETWTVVTEYPLQSASPFRLVIDPRAPDTFYVVGIR